MSDRIETAEEPVDQPDGICAESVDDLRIPSPAKAAARVDTFVRWFGDGLVLDPGEDGAPLYARDLCALTCAVQHGYRADEPSRCPHQPPAPLPAAAPDEREAFERAWDAWDRYPAYDADSEQRTCWEYDRARLRAALAARPAPVVSGAVDLSAFDLEDALLNAKGDSDIDGFGDEGAGYDPEKFARSYLAALGFTVADEGRAGA